MSIRPVPSMRVDRRPQVIAWRAAESRRAAQQRGQSRRRRGQGSPIETMGYRVPPGRGGQEHEEASDG